MVHLSYHVQKRQFEKGGWLSDLTPYMKDPALTAPDLVDSDFSAAGLQYAKNDKGQMLSLPWSVDYFILYYNKEMFQKKGIEIPKTLDEMVTAAEKLDRSEGGDVRVRRPRPAQRQHDAMDQFLPELWW